MHGQNACTTNAPCTGSVLVLYMHSWMHSQSWTCKPCTKAVLASAASTTIQHGLVGACPAPAQWPAGPRPPTSSSCRAGLLALEATPAFLQRARGPDSSLAGASGFLVGFAARTAPRDLDSGPSGASEFLTGFEPPAPSGFGTTSAGGPRCRGSPPALQPPPALRAARSGAHGAGRGRAGGHRGARGRRGVSTRSRPPRTLKRLYEDDVDQHMGLQEPIEEDASLADLWTGRR